MCLTLLKERIHEALTVVVLEVKGLLEQLWGGEPGPMLVTLHCQLQCLDATAPEAGQDALFQAFWAQRDAL